MRILWHSNAPFLKTGYGQQTAIWAPRLRDLGHDEEGPVPAQPAAQTGIAPETLQKIKQGLQDLIRICAEVN